MSSNAEPVPLAPDRLCDTENVHSPSHPIEIARQFTAAVRLLASNADYKYVADLIKEIPRLEELVRLKDGKIGNLRKDIRELEVKGENLSRQLIRTYEKEYDQFKSKESDLLSRIQDLEKQCKGQEEDVRRLMASESELKEKGRQVKSMWLSEKETVSKANKKIESLEEELNKAVAENAQLNKVVENLQVELAGTEQTVRSADNKIRNLEQQLRATSENLKEMKGLGVLLEEEGWEKPLANIEEIWSSLQQLVETYFGRDLGENVLYAPSAWTLLKAPVDLPHQIPLPASDSTAAKLMRTSTISAIIARLIDKHIFQPTFLLEKESNLRGVLLRQAAVHRIRESFTRSLLLNMFPEEQKSTADRMVTMVLEEIRPYIRNLLPQDGAKGFEEELRSLVCAARDSWWSIQRLKERLEPSFELIQFEDFDWNMIQLKTISSDRQSGNRNSKSGQKEDDAILMVFPRICIVEDEEPYPLSRGTVITKSQVEKATQEIKKATASTPPVRRLLSARTRRHGSQDTSKEESSHAESKSSNAFLAQKGSPRGKLSG